MPLNRRALERRIESLNREPAVVSEIRTFRNADVPALAEVWMHHHSQVAPPPVVTAAMMEQAILSRTFFDPSALLVLEVEDRVQGWCHYAVDPRSESAPAVICAFCLVPEAAASLGADLLAATFSKIESSGFREVLAGVIRDDQFGYAGLAPVGHGIGIVESDSLLNAWLLEQGFAVDRSAIRMAISTDSFRIPVSRESLQLRRSTRTAYETQTIADPRQASAMSHFDIERHQLLDRTGLPLSSLQLWCSDPEAEVMRSDHAILDIDQAQQRGVLQPAESFLVASVLQLLAGRRIYSVETAIDADQTELIEQLKQLNFQQQQRGSVWSKAIG